MSQKVIFILLAASLFLVFSCKKSEMQSNEIGYLNLEAESRDLSTLDLEDQRRADFAKVFAKALSNSDLRTYLKNKYATLDPLDREFVYAIHRNEAVSGSVTLQQMLFTYADSSFITKYGTNIFNTIIGVDPLLTIDFVEDEVFTLDDWTTSTIPLVGVATKQTIGFPSQTPGYPGYDNSGSLIRFDGVASPTSFSIWVKKSETLVAINRTTNLTFEGQNLAEILPGRRDTNGVPEFLPCETLLMEIEAIDYDYDGISQTEWPNWLLVHYNLLLDEYAKFCVDPTGGGGGNPCTEPCERDCVEADEILVKFRITGWNAFQIIKNRAFERWFRFRCIVPVLDPNNAAIASVEIFTYKYKKGDILDCNPSPCVGRWLTLDQRIWENWVLSEVRSPMQYIWVEDDSNTLTTSVSTGITPKLTVKVNDVAFEFTGPTFNITQSTISPSVQPLGSSPVFYCDPANAPGTTYSRPNYEMVVKHDN